VRLPVPGQFAFLLTLLVASAAMASADLRPFGGPLLSSSVADDVAGPVEFRYGFWLTAPQAAYVVNNPAPSNAAYGEGWTTTVRLHSKAGVTDLGALVADHPLELGDLLQDESYGLAFLVTPPKAALREGATHNLSFVLALHAPTCDCASNGATLDASVAIPLRLSVGEPAADPGAWVLGDLPPKVHDVEPEAGERPRPVLTYVVGAGAAALVLGLVLAPRRRKGTRPGAE
jgi:hypothetical protein